MKTIRAALLLITVVLAILSVVSYFTTLEVSGSTIHISDGYLRFSYFLGSGMFNSFSGGSVSFSGGSVRWTPSIHIEGLFMTTVIGRGYGMMFSLSRFCSIGLWPPVILLSGIVGFLFWRASRRIPPGHCQKCEYDLTGNVSGVCPECGEKSSEVISAGSQATADQE